MDLSHQEQRHILKEHFNLLFRIHVESQLIPEAIFETVEGTKRCLTGMPDAYHNGIVDYPPHGDWDRFIDAQISYYSQTKMPFVWYVDEEASAEFQRKLIAHGFQDGGLFQGVIGMLDKPILSPKIPPDYTLERVSDASSLDAFNELVCTTFDLKDESKRMYKKVLWQGTQSPSHPMFHWLARKEGQAVSALTTILEGGVVSFWNGASLPEVRKLGLSTALRCLGLQDAIQRGCRIGVSYLTSEGLARGICSKFGYEPKWLFHAYTYTQTS